MSIHSSFKLADTMKRHRSVLKRLERVKILSAQDRLRIEESSFVGLPKVKHLRIQVKKEKAAAPTAAASAPAAAATPPPASAPSAQATQSQRPSPAARPSGPKAGGGAKPEPAAQSKAAAKPSPKK